MLLGIRKDVLQVFVMCTSMGAGPPGIMLSRLSIQAWPIPRGYLTRIGYLTLNNHNPYLRVIASKKGGKGRSINGAEVRDL